MGRQVLARATDAASIEQLGDHDRLAATPPANATTGGMELTNASAAMRRPAASPGMARAGVVKAKAASSPNTGTGDLRSIGFPLGIIR
ncbi:hypothetical protein [Dyella sp. RRB7]|uniref:hypothetical protein n=1 Tax=Dyella sp. RRB7 TaxID=2919502 RepID=UPI001FAA3EEB|nr:hypothetical protein [Dyella sp. RRB7]